MTIRRPVMTAALMLATIAGLAGNGPVALSVSGRASAYASIAADGQFAVVVWGATAESVATDIYAAVSRDAGRTFGNPVRVNDVAGDARVSGEQPPRVSLVPRTGRDPSVVVVWTSKRTEGTRLLTSRSEDAGKSFARATVVPGTDAPGSRGWEAITTGRDGHVAAVWLDHRALAEPGRQSTPMAHDGQQHTGHASSADGAARAQLSKLYFGLLDGPAAPRAVTGGVCYCCKTAIASGPGGGVYVAWRHVYPGNVRDIAFTASHDGGRTFAEPIRVSDDRWVLDGCPENGPAIGVDLKNRVHVAWPTLVSGSAPGGEPTLALFYANSVDGRRFTPRQPIPAEGVARHPQIAIARQGQLLVAWDEEANGTRQVVLGRAATDASGAVHFTREGVHETGRGEHPSVAAASDGFIVAWTSGAGAASAIRVERVSQ